MLTSEKTKVRRSKVKVPHQRSPNAMKFEDKSQEETEKQERCARGDASELAKNIFQAQRKVSPSAIHNKTGGKKISCGFWR